MAKTKELCCGCRDDYYNRNRDDGCWMFANAKLVQVTRVGTWQPPPYKWNPQTRLSCYHGEGHSMLAKDDCRFVHNQKAVAPN